MFADLLHPEEAASGALYRFTDVCTVLPPALWAACRGVAILRVGFDPANGQRWLPPSPAPAYDAATDYGPEQTNVVSLCVA